MDMEISNLEKQIILYTKGWYERTNLIDDLKVIIGKYCSIDVEHLYLDSVYYWVSKIYFKLFTKYTIENHFVELFKWDKQHTPETFIKFMCSRILTIAVRNDNRELIIDLDKPDYNLLPKNESGL